jgi:hypothetical protein
MKRRTAHNLTLCAALDARHDHPAIGLGLTEDVDNEGFTLGRTLATGGRCHSWHFSSHSRCI